MNNTLEKATSSLSRLSEKRKTSWFFRPGKELEELKGTVMSCWLSLGSYQ